MKADLVRKASVFYVDLATYFSKLF